MELLHGSLLANSTPSPNVRLMLMGRYLELHSDFIAHYCQEIKRCFLFYRLFFKVSSTLVVAETIVLGCGESTELAYVIRANLLFIRELLIANAIIYFLNILTGWFGVFDILHL